MFGKKEQETDLCMFDKKPCVKERCKGWVHIRGQDPQSKAELDYFDCTMRWLPVLLMENSKETRQAAAAAESARNEARKDTVALVSSLLRRPLALGEVEVIPVLEKNNG